MAAIRVNLFTSAHTVEPRHNGMTNEGRARFVRFVGHDAFALELAFQNGLQCTAANLLIPFA